MNIGGWLATHRTQALLGAGGAVAGFALYRSKKAAHGSGPGGGGMFGTSASAAVPGVSGAYGPYDSSQLDQYNQLAGAISSANDQINALQTQLASNAVAPLPASSSGHGLPAPTNPLAALGAQSQHGSGLLVGDPWSPFSYAGSTYEYIGSPAQLSAYAGHGGQAYAETLPGVFQNVTTSMGSLAPGTPIYGTL